MGQRLERAVNTRRDGGVLSGEGNGNGSHPGWERNGRIAKQKQMPSAGLDSAHPEDHVSTNY